MVPARARAFKSALSWKAARLCIMKSPVRLFDPAVGARARGSHVLLVNFLGAWVAAFMTTSINIALPSIQAELRLDAVAVGWLPLAYMLGSAVFLLPFAKLGDRFGRRLIFLSGVGLFFLSSITLALSKWGGSRTRRPPLADCIVAPLVLQR